MTPTLSVIPAPEPESSPIPKYSHRKHHPQYKPFPPRPRGFFLFPCRPEPAGREDLMTQPLSRHIVPRCFGTRPQHDVNGKPSSLSAALTTAQKSTNTNSYLVYFYFFTPNIFPTRLSVAYTAPSVPLSTQRYHPDISCTYPRPNTARRDSCIYMRPEHL